MTIGEIGEVDFDSQSTLDLREPWYPKEIPFLPAFESFLFLPHLSKWFFSKLEAQRSESFVIEGRQTQRCHIGWINGINNTLKESRASAEYIQNLASGHLVAGVYNCTHGPILDILESAFLNHRGYSPNTAKLLHAEWQAFHEANCEHPHAKLLQICHSQGALAVKNALMHASPEIQQRVIVIAIAPAAVVPDRFCFKSYNYASAKDFIYKFEPRAPLEAESVHFDDVPIPTFKEIIDDRDELIILTPHSEATRIDHAFQSPTYLEVLKKGIENYYKNNGNYTIKPED